MKMVTVRTVIGIIGNVTSLCLFGSPIPTFWGIAKNKSVEEFKPDPYIAAVMNCMCWIFYGMPFVHRDKTLVITINSIGLLMELVYLIIFFVNTGKWQRWKIVLCLLLEVEVTAFMVSLTLLVFHTHSARSNFVGAFFVLFGVILYGSPLTIMWKVIQTKSVEFIPFWPSLASFSTGIIWTTYALLQFDLYILLGNSVGAVLGLAQLILYAWYRKSTLVVMDLDLEKDLDFGEGTEVKPPEVLVITLPSEASQDFNIRDT